MAFPIPIFWTVFAFSLTAVPIAMSSNKMLKYLLASGFHTGVIALTGITLLVTYIAVVVLVSRASSLKKKIKNPHFYVFSLFAFTSIIDLGIGLELDGYISGLYDLPQNLHICRGCSKMLFNLMLSASSTAPKLFDLHLGAGFLTEYLQSGEPYLTSPYGGVICYFDGLGMYAMYLSILYSITKNKSYRTVGLYWAGTLINSMIVLLLGIFSGKHGVFPATSLNIPYIIFPVVVAWQLFQERPKLQTTTPYRSLTQRPFDVFLIISLLVVIVLTVLRGVAVLDDKLPLVKLYLREVEPILVYDDPCPFFKIQMLLNLFYFIPVQVLSIHGLITPGCSWMQDLALFYAGATAQGQFSHIFTSIHSGIPESFRVPNMFCVRAAFWAVNLILTIIPHLLLIRSLKAPEFFSTQIKSNAGKIKKVK